jgi:hypothetical protein
MHSPDDLFDRKLIAKLDDNNKKDKRNIIFQNIEDTNDN